MGALSNAQAALLSRLGGAAAAEAAAAGSSGSGGGGGINPLAEPAPLPRVGLRAAVPWLASGAALAAVLLFGLRSRAVCSGWSAWMQPPVTAEAAQTAADIGLPPQALRPHYSAAEQQQAAAAQSWLLWPAPGAAAGQQQQQQQEEQQRQQQQQQQGQAAAAAEQQRRVAPISQQAATKLVQQWLVRTRGRGAGLPFGQVEACLAQPPTACLCGPLASRGAS